MAVRFGSLEKINTICVMQKGLCCINFSDHNL